MNHVYQANDNVEGIRDQQYITMFVPPRPSLTHEEIEAICAATIIHLSLASIEEMDVAFLMVHLPATLQILYLSRCAVGDAGAAVIAAAIPENLQELTLMQCGITDVGARALAAAVPTHPNLLTLQLEVNLMRPILEAFLARRTLRPIEIAVPWRLQPPLRFGNGVRENAERVWALYSGPSWARRFFRDQDGDHAVAHRVVRFLAG